MATNVNETHYHEERGNVLERTLTRSLTLNWQVVIFLAIFLMAVFTRFYNLGDRAMSHDESLHTYYSYQLYDEGKFVHTPLMHGPILFHMTAFFYSLFGDSDFTARIYTSILGVILVMTPLLFRRWLGKWGTILACLMILSSPLLMYYNRYIREDTPALLSGVLMIWGILMYLNGPKHQQRRLHWLLVISATMLWNLGSKETAFIYIAIVGSFLLLYWFVRLGQYFFNMPGQTVFALTSMSALLGGLLALGMYVIFAIIPLERLSVALETSTWFDSLDARSFLLWTMLLLASVAFVVLSTMLVVFRQKLSRIPLRELVIMAGATAIFLAVFVVIEERSHISSLTSNEVALSVTESETAVTESGFSMTPVYIPWVLMVILLAGLWYSRRANWWKHLDHFPELDVMLVMGSLIFPWLTAVFIVSTHGTPADFTAIANSVPTWLQGMLPVTSGVQTGQFIIGFLAWLPMMIIATVTGLTWNWRWFTLCWLTFHLLFVFFFTTVFTNIAGLATGMVYSLQYWLEQQGERRGNQPQYYYLGIIMPMYEYLPIVGSVLAMISGLIIFWRKRLADLEEQTHLLLLAQDTEDEKAKNDLAQLNAKYSPEALSTSTSTRHLTKMSFLIFVSYWAILNLIGYTLAGEKMPWLGTHLTTPMIFLTAWYFGGIIDRIEWRKFADRGWIYLLLTPFLIVALFQIVAQPLGGQAPFQGTDLTQIQATNGWLLAVFVLVIVVAAIYRLRQYTGGLHLRQMLAVGVFVFLLGITFRAAWVASFVNYDLATEYLVYAHATPGTKIMARQLEEISLATTNGYDLVFAYDDKMSWPGVWYFRHYDKNIYMGSTPTLQRMETATVVLVGEANRSVVEPLLEDRYQRFDYGRMWWPMMEYFNLDTNRLINLLYLNSTDETDVEKAQNAAKLRRGIFDIWWNRDYTAYGEAINKDFSLPRWPVQEKMYMYVRKDIAAQVWQYGTGDATLDNTVDASEVSACVANWQDTPASLVFQTSNAALRAPVGLTIGADGILYVADSDPANSRLALFNTQTGAFISHVGQRGTVDQAGAFFERPNSAVTAPDGSLYVVDTWNHSVRHFNSNFEQINRWGQWIATGFESSPLPPDGLWGPRDIAIDANGNIYVTDTGNKRVRVYSAAGVHIRDIGRGGSGQGQLDEPSGVVVSPDGLVYVADTWNRRISIFNTDGVFIESFNVRGWYDISGNRPYLALDAARNLLYVTDPDGGRVLVYNLANRECVGAFGRLNRENPTAAQFTAVGGITLDAEGNIYVTDPANGRVLRFDPFIVPEPVVENNDLSGEISVNIESTAEVNPPESLESTAELNAPVESTAEVIAPEEVTVTEEIAATEETEAGA